MKDKEMIEEMAKCMCSSYESQKGCKTCPTNWCYADECATMAYYNNYRKIDKDSVVLSKPEKQKLLHEMYEQGKFDALADLNKDGKVVLSREEYERLHSIEIAFEEFSKPDSVLIPTEEYEILKIKEKEKHWLETCMSVWKNAKIDGSKETAEKFAKAVKDRIKFIKTYLHAEGAEYLGFEDFDVDNILIGDFGVDIKE